MGELPRSSTSPPAGAQLHLLHYSTQNTYRLQLLYTHTHTRHQHTVVWQVFCGDDQQLPRLGVPGKLVRSGHGAWQRGGVSWGQGLGQGGGAQTWRGGGGRQNKGEGSGVPGGCFIKNIPEPRQGWINQGGSSSLYSACDKCFD